MVPPTTAHHDRGETLSWRRTILARASVTAKLLPEHIAKLLAACTLTTVQGGRPLFASGSLPHKIYLIGSGFVQLRICTVGVAERRAPAMHLRLLGPGDLVADRELACLAAGATSRAPRRLAAFVLGDPAEILAIDQSAFAAVLAEDPGARGRVAEELVRLLDAMECLANELASLKNHGKIRLARYLLELFDRMAQPRGGVMQLPHAVSHTDIASALGLTRRSVFDDILALEDFGAIDHSRDGHLTLCDRTRLLRIAHLAPGEDRDISAGVWREDVATALAANDTLRGFELAREALVYQPRDEELRYLAVLSALRAGLVDEAEALIAAFAFDRGKFGVGERQERVAALQARVLKERAFSSRDRKTLQSCALQSAALYYNVHEVSRGTYSALNAAAMYCVAGEMEIGRAAARALAAGPVPVDAGYWAHATRAEALWLLGEIEAAAGMFRRAVAAADFDDGKLATTRLQLRRLSACLGRDAAELARAFPPRNITVCTSAARFRRLVATAPEPLRAFVVIAGAPDFAACDHLDKFVVELVLAAPLETLLRGAPDATAEALTRHVCHVADISAGPVSPARRIHAWRLAYGLAQMVATEWGADVRLLTDQNDRADALPGWAVPDHLAGGQSAVLWLQATTETQVARIADGAAAVARADAPGMVTLSFSCMSEALIAASTLGASARAAGIGARICLDVENLCAKRLDEAMLPRLQPACRPGEIFATQGAAAEIALLRRTDLDLAAVGRVRSQRRLNRMHAWMVRPAGAWA